MFEHAEVDILVNGKPIKKLAHNGKVFVQSNHDTEYAIRIRNNSWSRRLFVITVDGINVVDEQAGGTSTMGYIINGYSSAEIKGFRTDLSTVHPFKFAAKRHSFAAHSETTGGDTSNCGVIGVQVYDEKQKPIIRRTLIPTPEPYNPWSTPWKNPDITWTASSPLRGGTMSRSMNCSAQDLEAGISMDCATMSFSASVDGHEPKAKFDMGTEFSEQAVSDVVTEVSFEVGNLVSTTVIYYASRQALQSMGVPVTYQKQIPVTPNPFPKKFCSPPRR